VNRALIIKKEWLDKIFDGGKVWEMRSTKTNICEKIGLIEQGTGLIVGECWLTGSRPAIETIEAAFLTKHLHGVEDLSLLERWKYPWGIDEAKRFEQPIPYRHPKGAVIWVKNPLGNI
jgi:hypothetical protein